MVNLWAEAKQVHILNQLSVFTTAVTCFYNSCYMFLQQLLHVFTTAVTCFYNSCYMYSRDNYLQARFSGDQMKCKTKSVDDAEDVHKDVHNDVHKDVHNDVHKDATLMRTENENLGHSTNGIVNVM